MVKRIVLDRAAMFAALRKDSSPLFNRRLAQSHVEGIEAILDSADRHQVTDIDHVAQMLAQTYHETGTYMLGIKETVMPSHKDKRPSDATVIKRLDTAWAKGQLSWVSTPYWRDGGFGRGPIQLTHWSNYLKMGTALGVDLRANPDLALDPKIGADIVVVGMSKGMFTGKKLSDYAFPACLYLEPAKHPRRIVNGKDGTDADIAKYHVAFRNVLVAGGYKVTDVIVAEQISAGSITSIVADKIPVGSIVTDLAEASVELVKPASKWSAVIDLLSWISSRK
jgi:hypothetical protein